MIVFLPPMSPSPINRGVNPIVTLVGANKHFCHRCRLYHLSGEAKERQQLRAKSLLDNELSGLC
jgi:hypothetical protein